MGTAEILRIVVGLTGLFILWVNFLAMAKRKMKEYIGVGWFLGGLLLILLAAVPGLSDWTQIIPAKGAVALVIVGDAVLWGLFSLSCNISQLVMKNQELAMQVSLLNQENEKILHQIELLTGKTKVNL